MFDRGFFLTLQAVRRQLAAMPHELYLVRLIHQPTRRPAPGECLWTATLLTQAATVRFLRGRNREGCDIYLHPYTHQQNSGYVLVDLDQARAGVLASMRANGHEPCAVLQTSPGHLQAWVQVSATPIPPAVASRVGKQLAQLYGGDRASTDWRHLGRLAGFTNQKPQRRKPRGYSPWVKVLYARPGLASRAAALLQTAECGESQDASLPPSPHLPRPPATPTHTADAAAKIYAHWLHRLRIPERFPQPDWSIADKWIAKELFRRGTPAPQVAAVLAGGSPGFPRRHAHPEDYLRRTLQRARLELQATPFPRRDPSFPPPGC